MRISAKLIFSLALICLVAQGSVIENLLNNTKFRGKAVVNTTKGLSLGYNGGVSFNFRGREIKLVDLGANFNAEPELPSSNDASSTTVRYNGALTFNEGTNTSSTNVTLIGVTNFLSAINSTYDNTTQTTNVATSQTISDNSTIIVRSAVTTLEAKSSETLSTVAAIAQKGNSVQISQNSGLAIALKGSGTSNGTSLGQFNLTSNTNTSTSEGATLWTSSYLPNVTYTGTSGFVNVNSLFLEGTSYDTSKNGSTSFAGYTNIKNGNGSIGVFSNQGLAYSYVSSLTVNNTVKNASSVSGIGKVFSSYDTNATTNGSSTGYFTGGSIYQVAKNTFAASQAKRSKSPRSHRNTEMSEESFTFEESTDEESGEFWINHAPRKPFHRSTPNSQSYYSTLTTEWKTGALLTSKSSSNTTAVTNTTVGTVYKAAGINTLDFKPWSTSGNESVTTSFTTTIISQQAKAVDNITVNTNINPEFNKKMAQIQIPKLDKKSLKLPNKPRL